MTGQDVIKEYLETQSANRLSQWLGVARNTVLNWQAGMLPQMTVLNSMLDSKDENIRNFAIRMIAACYPNVVKVRTWIL